MSDFEFDFPMPKQQKKLLLDIIRMARKNNVLSSHFSSSLDINGIYHIGAYFNNTDRVSIELPENPAPAFEMLGLVKYDEENNSVVLTPKAFKWAAYESKNWFTKFLARLPSRAKDLMIFIAFMLSLVLTILQILESIKSTP
jgi:hypothetical protein